MVCILFTCMFDYPSLTFFFLSLVFFGIIIHSYWIFTLLFLSREIFCCHYFTFPTFDGQIMGKDGISEINDALLQETIRLTFRFISTSNLHCLAMFHSIHFRLKLGQYK